MITLSKVGTLLRYRKHAGLRGKIQAEKSEARMSLTHKLILVLMQAAPKTLARRKITRPNPAPAASEALRG